VALCEADAEPQVRCGVTGRPGRVCAGACRTGPGTAKVSRSAADKGLRRARPGRQACLAALQRGGGLACGGTMAVRWCAARMLEADHPFRRVNGHLHLPKLGAARPLEDTSRMSEPRARMRTSKRHDDHQGRHRNPTGLGTISVLVTATEATGWCTWCCLALAARAGWEERTAQVDA
jgi:hypothetical protein